MMIACRVAFDGSRLAPRLLDCRKPTPQSLPLHFAGRGSTVAHLFGGHAVGRRVVAAAPAGDQAKTVSDTKK
jgi:hypothetical protein